jgi:hypothetical protein
MVLVARALRASRCKDAGSPRTERSTRATEDGAARRSGAFWRHSHCFAKPSQEVAGYESTRYRSSHSAESFIALISFCRLVKP